MKLAQGANRVERDKRKARIHNVDERKKRQRRRKTVTRQTKTLTRQQAYSY